MSRGCHGPHRIEDQRGRDLTLQQVTPGSPAGQGRQKRESCGSRPRHPVGRNLCVQNSSCYLLNTDTEAQTGGTWCGGFTISPAHVSSPFSWKFSSTPWPPAAAPAKGPLGCRRDAIAFPGAPPSVRGFPRVPRTTCLPLGKPCLCVMRLPVDFPFDCGTS